MWPHQPILTQAAVLVVVGVAMTIAVYGAVGLIVKMDDIGLVLARRDNGGVRGLGRGLVKGMPVVMSALSVIGTAAMLWVGGGILVHGSHTLGMHWPRRAAGASVARGRGCDRAARSGDGGG